MSRERERFDDERGKNIKREEAHGSQKGMKGFACAACKYYRRKCDKECDYAQYFPPHDAQKFASVHKLFGGTNFLNMIKEVPEYQRAAAATSLLYEANMRQRDPVHGCTGYIFTLEQQIKSNEAELNALRALKYRMMREAGFIRTPDPTNYSWHNFK